MIRIIMSRRKESRQHWVHGLASSCQIPVAYTWRSLIEGLRQPRFWFTRSRGARKRNDLRLCTVPSLGLLGFPGGRIILCSVRRCGSTVKTRSGDELARSPQDFDPLECKFYLGDLRLRALSSPAFPVDSWWAESRVWSAFVRESIFVLFSTKKSTTLLGKKILELETGERVLE